jgi:GNAT superfamily N-acetyltransferase
MSQELTEFPVRPPKANFRRQDANPFHVAAYRKNVGIAQEDILDRIAGTKQLSLAQLATHPDYWRRGLATALLNWGTELGRREIWPITVFAGPTAYSLYSKFGFKTAGIVVTAVAGEDDVIGFPAMIWEPTDSGHSHGQQPPQLRVVYDPVTQS